MVGSSSASISTCVTSPTNPIQFNLITLNLSSFHLSPQDLPRSRIDIPNLGAEEVASKTPSHTQHLRKKPDIRTPQPAEGSSSSEPKNRKKRPKATYASHPGSSAQENGQPEQKGKETTRSKRQNSTPHSFVRGSRWHRKKVPFCYTHTHTHTSYYYYL